MSYHWKVTAIAFALLASPADSAQSTITIGMALEPPVLDPTANSAAAIDEVVYSNIFEGLTKFGPNGAILPSLAESWDIEDDGRTYIFYLHDGVKFHDGADFTADDVVFSLNRARAEDSVNAQKVLFAGIDRVEAVDPVTVRITLSAPDGMFPFKMAWGDAVILDEASIANETTRPVGTGPFRFSEWRQGDMIKLEAFDDYWGDKPALKSATFRFIGDPSAAFAAIMAQDVDAFPIYPAPETLAQIATDPRFKVIIGTTEGETILAMNEANAPLNNIKIREAIAHAINRQELIDGVMFGYGTPIGTHFAPHHPDYVDLTAKSAYDPEKSKELLLEAGVQKLKLRLALPPVPYARRGGELLAAQLRVVGIETVVTNMEWAQWLDVVYGGHDYDLTIISHVEPMDIGIYARDDYYFNYRNQEFRDVIAEVNAATDEAKRSGLLKQAQTIIADDYANGFLFQLPKIGVANAKIEGLWENSPTPANDLSKVYWID